MTFWRQFCFEITFYLDVTSGGMNQSSVNMKSQCLFTIVFSKLLSHMDRTPANTLRNNDGVITSRRRHLDVITSKWRRFDVITTLLLRHVFRGWHIIWEVLVLWHMRGNTFWQYGYLNLYSLNGRMSHRKISWSLEATRFGFRLLQSP